MKRVHSSNAEASLKRIRTTQTSLTSEAKFLPNLQYYPSDVLEDGGKNTAGFLRGRVHMRWPWSNNKLKMILNCDGPSGIYTNKIYVLFTATCIGSNFKELLSFDIDDKIELSLEGAKVEKIQKSNTDLPLQISYEEGVAFRYVNRKSKHEDDGIIVDTWSIQVTPHNAPQKGHSVTGADPGDWYACPAPDYADFHSEAEAQPSSTAPKSTRLPAQLHANALVSKSSLDGRGARQSLDFFDEIPGSPRLLKEVQKPSINESKSNNPSGRSLPPTLLVEHALTNTSPHSGLLPLLDTTTSNNDKQEIQLSEPYQTSLMTNTCLSPHAGRPQITESKAIVQTSSSFSRYTLPPQAVATVSTGALEEQPKDDVRLPNAEGTKKKLSKREKRELKKEKKKVEQAAAETEGISISATSSRLERTETPLELSSVKVSSHSTLTQAALPLSTNIHKVESEPISTGPDSNTSQVYAGESTTNGSVHQVQQMHQYPKMVSLASMVGKRVDLIAVVASVQDVKSVAQSDVATDKWSKVICLVDDTNFDATDVAALERGTAGFAITCFTKQFTEWLPTVKQGDVIILRSVKVAFWTKVRGTVYADQLQWAIYEPSLQAFMDAGESLPAGIPRRAFMGADGDGVDHTPFFQLDATAHPDEISLGQKLYTWWRDVTKQISQSRGIVHHVGTPIENIPGGGRAGRQHHLLKDCSPSMHPQGFFDSTVEVLHKRDNGNGYPYSLWVTDYTRVNGAIVVKDNWCPEELGELVLKVELWDSARGLGETIRIGDYLSMNNAKMVKKPGGYVEAKCQESKKIVTIDERDVEPNPYLANLLERRNTWKESGSDVQWPHILIEAIDRETRFFRLVVEILHVDQPRNNNPAVIYVTDYTQNALLPPLPAVHQQAKWAQDLPGYILQIALKSEQEQHLHSLKPGTFFMFRSLQMKEQHALKNGLWAAQLGGGQKLFDRLNTQRPRQELQTLFERKKQLFEIVAKTDASGSNSRAEETVSVREHSLDPDMQHRNEQPLDTCHRYLSIQDALSLPSPSKFRIKARIVGLCPSNLENCAVEQCTSCHKILEREFKLCRDCMETDDAPSRAIFHFFLRVKGEDGWTMDVFVSSDQKCSLIDGLDAHLMDNDSALRAFRKRMARFAGNIGNITPSTKPPLLLMTVQSWNPSDLDMKPDRVFQLIAMDEVHPRA